MGYKWTNATMKMCKVFMMVLFGGLLMASCSVQHDVFMRGDVIKFSDALTTSYKEGERPTDFDPKSKTHKSDYMRIMGFVTDTVIGRGNNTAALYAFDEACNRVKFIRKNVAKNDMKTKYYMILLTDGLDNVSCQVAKNMGKGNYSTIQKYHEAWKRKMEKAMGRKKNYFVTYPCMYAGDDMKKMKRENFNTGNEEQDSIQFTKYLEKQMSNYCFASKGNVAPRAIVAYTFDELKQNFFSQFENQNFEFHVPKGYVGKRIKMELTDDSGYKCSFEGTFVKKGSNFMLQNVKYDGLTINTTNSDFVRKGGNELIAFNNDSKDELTAWFRLTELKQLGNGGRDIKMTQTKSEVAQKFFEEIWLTNSEYKSQANKDRNAYIIIAIDGSKSLGNMVVNEINAAREIISFVAGLAQKE